MVILIVDVGHRSRGEGGGTWHLHPPSPPSNASMIVPEREGPEEKQVWIERECSQRELTGHSKNNRKKFT
jgi:hypothetical protein